MKKRLIAMSMAGLMALSLAACGSSKAPETTAAAAAAPAATEAKAEAEEAAPAASGDAIVLKWSEVNGDEYGATVGAKAFAEKIKEVSGGQITVDLYTNGTLGDEKT